MIRILRIQSTRLAAYSSVKTSKRANPRVCWSCKTMQHVCRSRSRTSGGTRLERGFGSVRSRVVISAEICTRTSWRRENLADAQVESISCRRRVVDRDTCTAERRWAILSLHPIRVAGGGEVLMHQRLVRPQCARDCVVVIVAYAEHPGIVSCRNERRGWRT